MAESDKSVGSDDMSVQVTRVPAFRAPRRIRDVDIKIECTVRNCKTCEKQKEKESEDTTQRSAKYSVLWTKASQKKHKTWENDGFLLVNGNDLTLQDLMGKILDTTKNYKLPNKIESGLVLKFGGKEVQIQDICENLSTEQEDDEYDDDDDDDDESERRDDRCQVLQPLMSEDTEIVEPLTKKRKVQVEGIAETENSMEIVYSILWAKASQKKHKTWAHDGFLFINGNDLTLKDLTGNILDSCKGYKLPDDLEEGYVLKFGGREVQLQDICEAPSFGQKEDDKQNDNNLIRMSREDDENQVSSQKQSGSSEVVYSILWAKASQKKHKIWEHDGFLIINGNDLTLQDTNDKVLDTCKNYKLPDDLESGTILKLGFREIQIQDICSNSSDRVVVNGPCILELMGQNNDENEIFHGRAYN